MVHVESLARYLRRVESFIPSVSMLLSLGRVRAGAVTGALEYLDAYRSLEPETGEIPSETFDPARMRIPRPVWETAEIRAQELSGPSARMTPEAVIQLWYQRGFARWALNHYAPEDGMLLDTLRTWAEERA
ncbi:MAG: hypothetical protein L0099_07355 [Acidobacteria bacterium]|nr:hypothetical protein [Acidobacteriota bacterium]